MATQVRKELNLDLICDLMILIFQYHIQITTGPSIDPFIFFVSSSDLMLRYISGRFIMDALINDNGVTR